MEKEIGGKKTEARKWRVMEGTRDKQRGNERSRKMRTLLSLSASSNHNHTH